MKWWFWSLVILFMIVGCERKITRIEKETSISGADFREYTKKGFLFTPYSYNGKYEPVGLVIFSIKSGAEYKSAISGKKSKENNPYITDYSTEYKIWFYDYVEMSQVVEFAYKKAIEMGANALCDFKINFEYESVSTGVETISLPVLKVSGFAIKRLVED